MRAIQADTSTKKWVHLLSILAWIINTTRPSTLLKGVTPFKAWFGRDPNVWKPLKDSDAPPTKEPLFRSHASVTGSNNESIEEEEEEEEVDEEGFVEAAEEAEAIREEYILSELSQRVAEYTKGVQERMVKKKGANIIEFEPQEIATLAINKKVKFSVEIPRILVRILIAKGLVSHSLRLCSA